MPLLCAVRWCGRPPRPPCLRQAAPCCPWRTMTARSASATTEVAPSPLPVSPPGPALTACAHALRRRSDLSRSPHLSLCAAWQSRCPCRGRSTSTCARTSATASRSCSISTQRGRAACWRTTWGWCRPPLPPAAPQALSSPAPCCEGGCLTPLLGGRDAGEDRAGDRLHHRW